MRLKPIEKPPSLLGKLMTFAINKTFGKAFISTQIIYNRISGMWWMMLAIMRIEAKFEIDRELGLLISTAASTVNGCRFCADIARAQAVQERIGVQRFTALLDWKNSSIFTPAERAALAYVEEINISRDVTDDTFENLTRHFTEQQIAEITLQNAIANFHNFLNIPMNLTADGLELLAIEKINLSEKRK